MYVGYAQLQKPLSLKIPTMLLQGGYYVRNVRMYGNENRGVRMGRNVRSVSKSVRITEFRIQECTELRKLASTIKKIAYILLD